MLREGEPWIRDESGAQISHADTWIIVQKHDWARYRVSWWRLKTSFLEIRVSSNTFTTMRAIFVTLVVAVVSRVYSLSCPCWDKPIPCERIGCCDSGELTGDVCGCCDVCAKVVCQSYMPYKNHTLRFLHGMVYFLISSRGSSRSVAALGEQVEPANLITSATSIACGIPNLLEIHAQWILCGRLREYVYQRKRRERLSRVHKINRSWVHILNIMFLLFCRWAT